MVAQHKAVYDSAGIIGLGERIWLLAKLPDCINVHGNDVVNKYLLLTNSHDGSYPLRIKLAPIRVICHNTLASDLQSAGETQHGGTFHGPQHGEQAATLLAMTYSLYEQLDGIFNRMAETRITEKQLREYVHALLPDDEQGLEREAIERSRNEVLRLHESGWGAELARGTVWGAFNSITEYTDHVMVAEDPARRLHSIWFGKGERVKRKAFHLATQMMRA
jgi:phage/plasmid-like protein (TIGR03299 family)